MNRRELITGALAMLPVVRSASSAERLTETQLAGLYAGQNTVANNIYQPLPTKNQPKTVTVKGGGATCRCGKGAVYKGGKK